MGQLAYRWRRVFLSSLIVIAVVGAFLAIRIVRSSPPPPANPPENPAVAASKEALKADKAKPRFLGELGDFSVVGPKGRNINNDCPQGFGGGTEAALQASEINFSLPGADVDAIGACAGIIISVRQLVGDAVVVRSYFTGPKVGVFWNAPLERLQLTMVAGRPALEELPVPGDFASHSRITVIERFPGQDTPGVFLSVDTNQGIEAGIALIEKILAGGQQ